MPPFANQQSSIINPIFPLLLDNRGSERYSRYRLAGKNDELAVVVSSPQALRRLLTSLPSG